MIISMSAYIKGLEIPKPKFTDLTTIYDAYILVSPNGQAAIVVDNKDGLDSTEYSLISISPHGDLIDRDVLTISTAVPLDGKPYQYVHIDNIKAAPVVIPAEEDEE